MANNDEDLGHSTNYDLRMAGMCGDDESDLDADREDLFGSAAEPIEVDDCDGDGDAGDGDAAVAAGDGEAAATAGDGSAAADASGKKKQKLTSDAWLDFEKIFEVIDGKQVRTGAKCYHCGHVYTGRSAIGTGHLLWRVKVCDKRKANMHLSQSVLSFSSDGSVRHWEYSAEVARTQLCRMIDRLDLPLCVGASPAFEEYIRLARNPRFTALLSLHKPHLEIW